MARSMPKVQNLHHPSRLINAVVNQNRRMYKLPDPTPALNRPSDEWKRREEVDMIQKSVAEAFGEIRPCVSKNLFKVRQRGF